MPLNSSRSYPLGILVDAAPGQPGEVLEADHSCKVKCAPGYADRGELIVTCAWLRGRMPYLTMSLPA